jgi:hypothetical protein
MKNLFPLNGGEAEAKAKELPPLPVEEAMNVLREVLNELILPGEDLIDWAADRLDISEEFYSQCKKTVDDYLSETMGVLYSDRDRLSGISEMYSEDE